jgi:hypothetical protein
MYQIVYDEAQVLKFYETVLPRLKKDEVYFVSLSARNKYLTAEERELYNLGRTEMYGKTIIHEDTPEAFLRHIYRFECNERGYTTRNGQTIPSKCTVCYVNIHPSSVVKAIAQFQKLLTECMTESMAICVDNRDTSNFVDRIVGLNNNLMAFYQQASGTKRWMDFDLDMEKDEEFRKAVDFSLRVVMHVTDFVWIDTKSGYHLLVDCKQYSNDPNKLVEYMHKVARQYTEIKFNSNSMVPLPGTTQSNYPVRILENI